MYSMYFNVNHVIFDIIEYNIARFEAAVSAATALKACLAVCGIPVDATSRELHVLFSGCPGHLDSTCSDY